MRVSRFCQQDGVIRHEMELTPQSLFDALGMMVRCYMRDGSCHDGFVSFTPGWDVESLRNDYGSSFFLWTWAHLDEATNQLVGTGAVKYEQNFEAIDFREVEHTDAILYSNPRWGGRLHNRFFVDVRPPLG